MLSPDSSVEEIQAVFKENYLDDENQQEICWLLFFAKYWYFNKIHLILFELYHMFDSFVKNFC